jgi:hypothetical protein
MVEAIREVREKLRRAGLRPGCDETVVRVLRQPRASR